MRGLVFERRDGQRREGIRVGPMFLTRWAASV